MVTPGNVLVPPIWHFILLYHPVPSAFPSPHTGITLIMIIAVMIMITTAKLHSLSLSLIFNTQGIMIDWKAACKCFPRPIFFSCARSVFVSSVFLIYLAFSYFPCSLHSLLTPSPAYLLSLFSLFQFYGSLSSLLLCSFQPFLVHLTSATCPRLSPFLNPGFQPLFSTLVPLSTLLLSCLLILLLQRNKIN